MQPANARETLLDLIDEIMCSLEEVQTLENNNTCHSFDKGRKFMLVQLLEFIQHRWEESQEVGLDFDIELFFPV